jgi:hypothetical protein
MRLYFLSILNQGSEWQTITNHNSPGHNRHHNFCALLLMRYYFDHPPPYL